MDDLIAFMRAQLEADGEVLQGSGDLGWVTFLDENGGMRHTSAASTAFDEGWFIDGDERTDFARAVVVHREAERLADVRAKRQIMDLHPTVPEDWATDIAGDCRTCSEPAPCRTVRALALPYADRPGYCEEWRP
jgi:hypothetical protein